MWGVMKGYGWDSIAIIGVTIRPPIDGPQRFIPLFDTKEQALKFTNGDETHLVEMETTAIVPLKSDRKRGKRDRG